MTDTDLERCENTGLRKLTCWCKVCQRRRKRRETKRDQVKTGQRTHPDAVPPARKGTTLD